jgi:CheY-like chemotaxis protein
MAWSLNSCTALVIDPSANSRSTLSGQLRDLGIPNVVQCSKLSDARRRLETGAYDLVLCEMDFPEEGAGAATAGRTCWTNCSAPACCPGPPSS